MKLVIAITITILILALIIFSSPLVDMSSNVLGGYGYGGQ